MSNWRKRQRRQRKLYPQRRSDGGNICDVIPMHEPYFWYGMLGTALVVLVLYLVYLLI